MKLEIGDQVRVKMVLIANGEHFDYWENAVVTEITDYNYIILSETGVEKPIGKNSTEDWIVSIENPQ